MNYIKLCLTTSKYISCTYWYFILSGGIVQNKLHYAAHGHTAAEVIYERVDAEKPFMGLTTFKGELPALKDNGCISLCEAKIV